MGELTAFDIVAILLVGLSAIVGLSRGFVGEVFSLLAWVAGIAAVRFGFAPTKPFVAGFVQDEAGAVILTFVGLFLGAFILVRLLGGSASRRTKGSIIGPVDRLLGLGFGAAKGVLAAALLFLLINLTFDTIDPGEPSPDWIAKAKTAPTLAMLSKVLVDFVEERQRLDAATAASDREADPHQGLDADEDGYLPGQRGALDKLLDAQEKQEPSTAI
jgi:membrane protein required for colicin V production